MPPLAALEAQHIARETARLGLFDLSGRRAARARAQAIAASEWNGLVASAQQQQLDYQRQLDGWWGQLVANDPPTVMASLAAAFEDNEAAAAPIGVRDASASIVVHSRTRGSSPSECQGRPPQGT